MELNAAQLLADYSDELEVREDYSGRGMYGATTAGVVGPAGSFEKALGELFEADIDLAERADLAAMLRRVRTDNMGLETIWY